MSKPQSASLSAPVDRCAVDLRSDTVTRPTEAMYQRMASAPLGDDGLDGDPTAVELERFAAEVLGKEHALFVPSCTMANLLAILVHTGRTEQVIVEATSHIYNAERGGATLSGAFYLPVAGRAGAMDIGLLEDALKGNSSRVRTGLVTMETSHNNAGGAVLPLEHMTEVRRLAERGGARTHIDGARLFNAAMALGVSPARVARDCDSVALCLSKGLSAPMGAMLAGAGDFIARARNMRRALGGQQRQVGIAAAAGLEAIETMGGRLAEDHARAHMLYERLKDCHPCVVPAEPQTNIVLVDVSNTPLHPREWAAALAKQGVLVRPWRDRRLRCITHRHIDDVDIGRVAQAFQAVIADRLSGLGSGKAASC